MFVGTSLSRGGSDGDGQLQRACGKAYIALSGEGRDVRIDELYQTSPCRILLPRIDGFDQAEIVLVNSSGGIAGGDQLDYGVKVLGTATTLATTQASEKVYGAIDSDARLATTLSIGDGATLEWLPQQTIAFEGARLRRRTEINVEGSGRLLALDWLVMGRRASGEIISRGSLRDDWRVRRDGKLVWADAFQLAGDVDRLAARPAALNGNHAIATIIYVAQDSSERLNLARDLIGESDAGATVVGGILVARFLAQDGLHLYRRVSAFLEEFRAQLLELRPWPPRLWTC